MARRILVKILTGTAAVGGIFLYSNYVGYSQRITDVDQRLIRGNKVPLPRLSRILINPELTNTLVRKLQEKDYGIQRHFSEYEKDPDKHAVGVLYHSAATNFDVTTFHKELAETIGMQPPTFIQYLIQKWISNEFSKPTIPEDVSAGLTVVLDALEAKGKSFHKKMGKIQRSL